MPRRKKPPDRDARGETRQKYVNRVKRGLRTRFGPLPARWDFLASWPNGLDGGTWEESTHFWQLQHLAGKTSGELYGRFPNTHRDFARKSVVELARALKLGFVVLQTGDMSFSIYAPIVSPSELDEEPPEPVGIALVRCNHACDQYNDQAAISGIRFQKFDSFRRWLSRHGVRKHRIGGRVWHDVAHLNETLREEFGDHAPTIRGSPEAPVLRERRTT